MIPPSWRPALKVALLFVVLSSPMTYKLVDGLVGGVVRAVVPGSAHFFRVAEAGCPTPYGLAVHGVVFVLVAKYLLKL